MKWSLFAAKEKFEKLNPSKKAKTTAKEVKKSAVDTTPAPKTNPQKSKPATSKTVTKPTSKSGKKSLGNLVLRLAKKKEEEEGALVLKPEAPAKEQAAPAGQKKSRKTSKPSRLSQEPIIQRPLSLLEKAETAAEVSKVEVEEDKKLSKGEESVLNETETPSFVEENFASSETETVADNTNGKIFNEFSSPFTLFSVPKNKDKEASSPVRSKTSLDSQPTADVPSQEKPPSSPASSPVR